MREEQAVTVDVSDQAPAVQDLPPKPLVIVNEHGVFALANGSDIEIRQPGTGRFVKGHKPLAGAGRPKRGESLLAYTQKLVEKANNKQAVAEAKLDRLLDRGSVGNRAWAEYRDTYHGVPKQTLVLEQEESPLQEYLMRRHQRSLMVVEGESRVLDTHTVSGEGEGD